jgi:hypothetical protein
MKRHFIMFSLALFTLFTASGALAQSDPVSGVMELNAAAIGASGGASHGGAYALADVLGEGVVGIHASGAYTLMSGFSSAPPTVDNLVLLYFNGDNDLAEYVLEAARQAQAGAAITTTVTVVLMVLDGPDIDDSYLYRLDQRGATNCDFYSDYTCGGRYLLDYNVWKFDENLGSPTTLKNFLITSIQGLSENRWNAMPSYPSTQRIILSLVGHGGGWSPNILAGQPQGHGGQPGLGGLLWDNNARGALKGTSLSTSELGNALADAEKQIERKIDLLYLDACLMGMWEVMAEMQGSVHYLLASTSWTWTAFAYDTLLQELGKPLTIPRLGENWVQQKADTVARWSYPYTYSLVDLSQLAALTQAINELADSLIGIMPNGAGLTVGERDTVREAIYAAFQEADCFDSDNDFQLDRGSATEDGDSYCDLLSFAQRLKVHLTDYPAVVSASQKIVAHLQLGAPNSVIVARMHQNGQLPSQYGAYTWAWRELGGMSIYLPLNEKDEEKRKYYTDKQLQAAQGANGWDEFVNQYRFSSSFLPDRECPAPCALPQGPFNAPRLARFYLPLVQR